MAVHGKGSGVAIADYDITRWLDQVSVADAIEVADASCFDPPGGAKEFVQGMWASSATWSGRFGSEVAPLLNVKGVFEQILAAEVDVPFTIAPGYGFNPGSVCYMGPALATKLSVDSPISNVIAVTGSIEADGGFRYGVVLTPKADLTATLTGAAADNALSTATGGAGHLHVDGRSTLNGILTAKIQHSADNSTWADLITFTAVAAATGSGQRIELADGTSISRYTRALITLAGTTGSATVRVALSRRK